MIEQEEQKFLIGPLAFDFSLTGRGVVPVVVVVLGLLGGGGEAPATVRWAVSWCVSARNLQV